MAVEHLDPPLQSPTGSSRGREALEAASACPGCRIGRQWKRGRDAMLRLERLDPDRVDWRRLNAFDDRVVFQTPEWVAFVAETQHAEPVVAEVRAGSTSVGYFTGLVVRRFGM